MSDNWQNRIFNHEETPPNNAWENIAKQLDAMEEKKSSVIQTEVPSVVEQKKSKIIYWRMAAAACITAIIATTIIWMNIDNKNAPGNTHVAKVPVSTEPKVDNQIANINANNKATESVATVSKKEIFTNNKKTIDQTDSNEKLEYAKTDVVKSLATNPALNKKEKLVGTGGDVINDISLMNSPNSYVSFIGPNGQEVKVSSKFSNLVGYMDGKDPEAEENLDKIVSESNFWRGKFKKWRNKMINTNIAPSPSNFLDIVELSKLLNEQ